MTDRARALPVSLENCSLARAFQLIAERWTLLLLREAFYGVTRFDDMHQHLGISRRVLTERLEAMVENGLLARVPYRVEGQRTRYEYRLTETGRDLRTSLIAIMEWSDRHRPHPDGRPLQVVEPQSGEQVSVRLVTESGQVLAHDAELKPIFWPDRQGPK